MAITDTVVEDGIAISPDGDIYVSDYFGNAIRVIQPNNQVTKLNIPLKHPNGLAFDADGQLFIVNQARNQILKFHEGEHSTYAKGVPTPAGVAFNEQGDLFVTSYSSNKVFKIHNDGSKEIYLSSSLLNGPVGIAFGQDGTLFLANYNDGKVLKANIDGEIQEVARIRGGVGFIAYGASQLFLTGIVENKIYVLTEDDTLSEFAGSGTKASTDGSLQTASFDGPNGLAVSADGAKLYVTDFHSKKLRVITLN